MRPTLFRPEALDSHRNQHLGDVLLARPVALHFLTALGALIALGVVLFGCLAEYTRKTHVIGYLVPTKGLIKVYAPQAGMLTEKHAEEGRRVQQGDPLYVLSTERSSLQAREAQAAAIAQLRDRRSSLAREVEQQATLAHLMHQELGQRVRAMVSELAQLHEAIATQTERVASTRKTFERYEELTRQKFASEMQLSQHREQLLDQQARLQTLERSRTALEREIRTLSAE